MKYILIVLVCILGLCVKEFMRGWLRIEGDLVLVDFLLGWYCAKIYKGLNIFD